MSDDSGGNGGLYFIVGVLVAVVAIMGAAMTGHLPMFGRHADIVKIETPATPGR